MARKSTYDRIAWEDRFNRPTARQLRDGLPGGMRSLYDRTRKRLLELDGVAEEFRWRGDSWKWTIEYRTKHSDEPLAVVIPSPADLQLAVPLDPEFTRSLPVKRMKRAVRDGLELAQEPFDTRWGIWSINAMNMLEDLQNLIERKLRHEGKAVG